MYFVSIDGIGGDSRAARCSNEIFKNLVDFSCVRPGPITKNIPKKKWKFFLPT